MSYETTIEAFQSNKIIYSSRHLCSCSLSFHTSFHFFKALFIHSNSYFFFFFSLFLYFFMCFSKKKWILAENFIWGSPGCVWMGLRVVLSRSWNPNPVQVPPDDSIFVLYFFGFLLGLLFHYTMKSYFYKMKHSQHWVNTGQLSQANVHKSVGKCLHHKILTSQVEINLLTITGTLECAHFENFSWLSTLWYN